METVHEPTDGVNQKSRAAPRALHEALTADDAGSTEPAVPAVGLLRPADQVSSITNAGNGVDEDGGLRPLSGVSINQSNIQSVGVAGQSAIRRRK